MHEIRNSKATLTSSDCGLALHVELEVKLPTPGYEVHLEEKIPADFNPKILALHLGIVEPKPGQIVPQVETWFEAELNKDYKRTEHPKFTPSKVDVRDPGTSDSYVIIEVEESV